MRGAGSRSALVLRSHLSARRLGRASVLGPGRAENIITKSYHLIYCSIKLTVTSPCPPRGGKYFSFPAYRASFSHLWRGRSPKGCARATISTVSTFLKCPRFQRGNGFDELIGFYLVFRSFSYLFYFSTFSQISKIKIKNS